MYLVVFHYLHDCINRRTFSFCCQLFDGHNIILVVFCELIVLRVCFAIPVTVIILQEFQNAKQVA